MMLFTDELEAFGTFVRAVFYIGKGKRSRPYAHFKEAIQNLSGITSIQVCVSLLALYI